MIKRMLFMFIALVYFTSLSLITNKLSAIEMVIGEERVEPGVVIIFEAAIKDTIYPSHHHLKEGETHIHIEARANWDKRDLPPGTPAEGFVPYLYFTAKFRNIKTGYSTFIDLLPHMNLIDNFHYARNITLPGKIRDRYDVTFKVSSAMGKIINFHKDWAQSYGKHIIKNKTFKYRRLSFYKIAKATRG